MRLPFSGLVVSGLVVLGAGPGCGGTGALGNANAGASASSAAQTSGAFAVPRCGADEVVVAGTCMPLAGSTWLLTTHMPEGTRVFEIELHPGGRCTSHDPNDTTPTDDEWAIESKGLRFWFNQRYVVYEAELDGPREMHGVTHNVNDLSWPWTAVRVR